MQRTATALTSWTQAIKKTLEKAGQDSTALFIEAGLDLKALNDPDARYPVAQTKRLWQLAVARTGDSCFGLKVASEVNPITFHALGYTLIASSTLKEAFQRLVRYFRIVTDAMALSFSRIDDDYHFLIRLPENAIPPADEAVDAFTSVLIRMCRALLGRDYAPRLVALQRPAPADLDGYQKILRAPLQFNAPENRLVFDCATFEQPLAGANPELARHNDEIVLKYLARMDKADILAVVRAAIIERLPHCEPAQDDIARSVQLSTRSLQRRLAEEHSSYRQLLDDTRRELALSYIQDPHCGATEITYLLGFSDTSSFTRAFRRWLGMTPSEYRERL
jgi:AraC-like DNA-binding protein